MGIGISSLQTEGHLQTRRERRSFLRHTDARPARICRLEHGIDYPATLVDISRSGVQLLVSVPLSRGDTLYIDLPKALQPGFPMGRVRGCVVRSTERLSNGIHNYAVGIALQLNWWNRLYAALPTLQKLGVYTVMLLVIANVIFLKQRNVDFFWYNPQDNLYGLLVSVYILLRVVMAYFYRPPALLNEVPTVSVIVACKNEEDSIYRTLERIYAADYPPDLLQVIAVNDGSDDKTLAEMYRAQKDFAGLEVIDFPVNRGKRHGMAAGARAATGDILVYVDSDSFIRADALRQMVAGFADPEVGGVCGHAYAENAATNALTKMQEVRYYVAFRVVKAAESIFSAVTCCSGCLAAYRRVYVMEILDVWLQQRFLGTEATFGDDRSMTNFMLRRWRVIYNSEAVCTTLVPDSWRVFLRQQLRWKKSWIRESFIGLGFMWKRHPAAAFFFYFGVIFPLISPIVVLHAVVLPMLGVGTLSFLYAYGTFIMAGLYGLIYAARFGTRRWVYGVFFSFVYMLVLVWQTYYALFTLRRNHWGTR